MPASETAKDVPRAGPFAIAWTDAQFLLEGNSTVEYATRGSGYRRYLGMMTWDQQVQLEADFQEWMDDWVAENLPSGPIHPEDPKFGDVECMVNDCTKTSTWLLDLPQYGKRALVCDDHESDGKREGPGMEVDRFLDAIVTDCRDTPMLTATMPGSRPDLPKGAPA